MKFERDEKSRFFSSTFIPNGKEYWRLLAEEREKALNTTLEENGDLSEILEQRFEEVEGDIFSKS